MSQAAISIAGPQGGRHADVQVDAAGIATVTIRNAGALNILGTPVINELTQCVAALSGNADVRVMVLRGTGDKAFSGGADIKEMSAMTPRTAERFISKLRQLFDGIRHFPAPVIARMPGWTLGGGMELAMACDLRIAADNARLGMPEVAVGVPSVIHAALLPALIGQARATWMLLTGEITGAERALAWGLVHRMVPLADLDVEVGRMAALLAGYGPSAVRAQKRLLREWERQSLDTAIDSSVAAFGKAFKSGEPERYMTRFLSRKSGGINE